MRILEATSQNIAKGASVIKGGGLVAFPTETVYGLGADGLNPIAVAKIFEAKRRPAFNPLILHVSGIEQLYQICVLNNKKIKKLIQNYWPGPLTLVLPKKEIVPEIVTSGHPTVAVRMPDHKVALELITSAETPIAAPSANTFGFLSPTSAEHVVKQLGDRVDVILDGGKCRVGVESTIVQAVGDEIFLLRPGGLPTEEIEKLTGKIKLKKHDFLNPNSPGQLPYHYAPKIPMKFINRGLLKKLEDKKVGALLFKENIYGYKFYREKILSPAGDIREAAANLFSYLHELESEDLDLIIVEAIEEEGLGRAIMDRLKKASYKYRDG